MKYILILISLYLVGCATTQTGNLEDIDERTALFGKAASLLNSGNYKEGIPLLVKCAEAGSGGCAQRLGVEYMTGKGIAQNFEESEYWSLKAWETGTSSIFGGAWGALNMSNLECYKALQSKNFSNAIYWLDETDQLVNQLELEIPSLDVEHRDVLRKEVLSTRTLVTEKRVLFSEGRCF